MFDDQDWSRRLPTPWADLECISSQQWADAAATDAAD